MVFTRRSRAENLKILFDLFGLGAEELAVYSLAQPLFSGGIFRADFCQICHMELLGSDHRGLPGCLPNLGIISALQDFLQA